MALVTLPRDVLERITDAVELECLARLALANKAHKDLIGPVVDARWQALNRDADALWRAIRKGQEHTVTYSMTNGARHAAAWKATGLVPDDADWERGEDGVFRLGKVCCASFDKSFYKGTLGSATYEITSNGGLPQALSVWPAGMYNLLHVPPRRFGTEDYYVWHLQRAQEELDREQAAAPPGPMVYAAAATGRGTASFDAARIVSVYEARVEEARRRLEVLQARSVRPGGPVVAALDAALERVYGA